MDNMVHPTERDIEAAKHATTDMKPTKSTRRSRSSCCCCYVILFSLSLVVLLGVAAGAAWLVIQPKAPELGISGVRLIPAAGGAGALEVRMMVGNPNKKIGIHYDEVEVELAMAKGGSAIAKGSIEQRFYQPPKSEPPAEILMDMELAAGGNAIRGLLAEMPSGSGVDAVSVHVDAVVRMSVGSWTSGTSRLAVDCRASINLLALAQQLDFQQTTTSSTSANTSPPSLSLTSCTFKLKSFKL